MLANQLKASLAPCLPQARYARQAKAEQTAREKTGTPFFMTRAKIRGALPSCASINSAREEEYKNSLPEENADVSTTASSKSFNTT
jgi:hypothetical protein